MTDWQTRFVEQLQRAQEAEARLADAVRQIAELRATNTMLRARLEVDTPMWWPTATDEVPLAKVVG